jgi:diaminopimelate decarboxylase
MNNALIERIQREFGTRPFFLYDLDAFAQHLAKIKVPGVRFWYATKANPLSSILKIAHQAGFGIDCASRGEYRQALRAGVLPAQILLTGPSKSPKFFQEAIAAGISTFVLESLQQVHDLERVAQAANQKVEALLRLQISWPEEEKSVLGGSKISPFGIDAESWSRLPVSPLRFVKIKGVHCFQWGNILNAGRLAEIWKKTLVEAQALSKKLDFPLQVLDLGGGLGIPYQGEAELSLEIIQKELIALRASIPQTEIWMELGRYAIGAYGKYVSQVVDRKAVYEKSLLILEGGVHHLLRPALVKEAFPATLLRASNAKVETMTAHGPLCTALDELGTFSLPNDIQPGDSLVFHQCGAYGFTESMPYFLCHDLPAEFTLIQNELQCIRPWQSADSWLV